MNEVLEVEFHINTTKNTCWFIGKFLIAHPCIINYLTTPSPNPCINTRKHLFSADFKILGNKSPQVTLIKSLSFTMCYSTK